ncbi:MAG: molybdopterin molybdotransferase MoeA [Planctomycetota bacterium]|nr:molybdopterin molybdotransferase MoeA [Planctomycetota bacterium]
MRGFRERATVEAAREVALDGLEPLPGENVSVESCAGRVLATDVAAEVDVPPFRRAAMDGYAVVAEDTFGATLYDPIALRLVGESLPGGPGAHRTTAVGRGEACRIMTGARVPDGADAVLMAEDAEERGDEVLARAAVTPGKNVGRVGEDVARGDLVLARGRRLRPQDVGLLASIGHHPVRCVRRPRVRILVSGDELLPPGKKPRAGRIVDSNTPMLAALIERDGGRVEAALRLRDDPQAIGAALRAGADLADVVVAAGGSSVGREDHLPGLVRELGELPVHGVAMRPSSPTGIGRIGATPVFLLPGNPVSCLCAYDFFAGPAVRVLAGLAADWPHARVKLPLARRISSQVGRVDYVRVRVTDGAAEPLATSGASILSSTTRASGFVIVPASSEGLADGAEVEVRLYDGP